MCNVPSEWPPYQSTQTTRNQEIAPVIQKGGTPTVTMNSILILDSGMIWSSHVREREMNTMTSFKTILQGGEVLNKIVLFT